MPIRITHHRRPERPRARAPSECAGREPTKRGCELANRSRAWGSGYPEQKTRQLRPSRPRRRVEVTRRHVYFAQYVQLLPVQLGQARE